MAARKRGPVKEVPGTWERYALKGNVSQVRQTVFRAVVKKKGFIECTWDATKYKRNSVYTFNEKGIVTEKCYYDFQGNDIYLEKFNDKGVMSEQTCCDKDGNVKMKSVRENDENGNLIRIVTKGANHNSDTHYVRDDKGFIIEFVSYDEKGEIQMRQTFVNNEYGEVTDQVLYKKGGEFERRLLYKLNEWGARIETKTLNEDGSIQKVETVDLAYDAEGNLISYNGRKHRDKRQLETFKYEYDSEGNWIRRVDYFKGIPAALRIREINYFGDHKEKLELKVMPLNGIFVLEVDSTKITKEVAFDEEDEKWQPTNESGAELTPQQLQWVAESNRSGDFDARRFYIASYNMIPSEMEIDNMKVEVMALMKELKRNLEAYEIYSLQSEFEDYQEPRIFKYVLGFAGKPYLLYVSDINRVDDAEYDLSDFLSGRFPLFSSYMYAGPMKLFLPSAGTGKRDSEFEDELERLIALCTLEEKPDQPEIYMVEVSGQNYHMQSHPVSNNFEIRDLNINYGSGFDKFHSELMKRFKTDTRGLVLFHGEPGTGKTYYIRHLLKLLASEKKKRVIYMPPNMVDHLADPLLMTFISKTVTSYSNKGIFCVLLIEDAEPLLAKRVEGVRIQGITNLLNMTDGLLNDMLRLQIICTFNVDLKRLDSALLRPGRLVARKEFKALSELDANILAQRLGIKHHFKSPATLGEIYSMLKNQNTLVHDVDPDKGASTFIDDLI